MDMDYSKIRKGTFVRFAVPLDEGERKLKMLVIEDYGDDTVNKCIVEELETKLALGSQRLLLKSDLEPIPADELGNVEELLKKPKIF